MSHITGRTIVITGASRGIGKALALGLAKERAALVINSRSPAPLSGVAREIKSLGADAREVAGDAAEPETARALLEAAQGLGGPFGFIHNAGVARPGPLLWEMSPGEVMEVLGANLVAGFNLIKALVPVMRAQGEGLAVFMGSGAAVSTLPGLGAYCVAKAAEEHLARQLAAEAPEVTTFVYRPHVVDTDMQRQAREAEGGAAENLRRHFREYKETGTLISPDKAAGRLIKILRKDPRKHHGRVVDYTDPA